MTELTVSTSPATSVRADAIVVGVAAGGLVPIKGGEALGATLRALGATGAPGEAVKLPTPEGFAAPTPSYAPPRSAPARSWTWPH